MMYKKILLLSCLTYLGTQAKTEDPTENLQQKFSISVEDENVAAILELLKGVNIQTPDIEEPFIWDIWVRTIGIKLLYSYISFKEWMSEPIEETKSNQQNAQSAN